MFAVVLRTGVFRRPLQGIGSDPEGEASGAVSYTHLDVYKRQGLASALLGRPKLLLLDEPTNGLDPAGIQEMRELICSLPGKYGMTVMISSHLLSEIDQMATHTGIIDRGELIFQDSLAHLYEHSRKDVYKRQPISRNHTPLTVGAFRIGMLTFCPP